VHVPGGVVGGGGRCLLCRRVEAAVGAAAAAAVAQKSVGDRAPGTQATGGGGTRRLRRGAQWRCGVSSLARGEGAGGASGQRLAKGEEVQGETM
jgi:hypothetical protein